MGCSHSQPQWQVPAVVALLVVCFLTPSCCSIIHQTMQEVAIGSDPTKASVTVDAQQRGETPLVVELKRKNNHTIRLELEGYQPHEMSLTRKVSGWVWGNIVFGGLIGLAVDAINGAMYKLTPEQVQATLSEAHAKVLYSDDQIYVFVTLRAAPEWEQVSALAPVAGE